MLLSFTYAWSGLAYVYTHERNMRFHVFAAASVGAVCIILGVSRLELLMITLAVAGVFVAEVVNTVAERLTDLMEPEYDVIAKATKDVAAAGVLLASFFSVIIGVIAFYPALIEIETRLTQFYSERIVWFAVYALFIVIPSFIGIFLVRSPGESDTRDAPGR